MDNFSDRHYPTSILQRTLGRAKSVSRESSLLPSDRPTGDRPIVVIPYHPHNLPIKRILLDNWNILKKDPTVGKAFAAVPLVAYKRMRNIKDHVVRSRLRDPHTNGPQAAPGTHPCTKLNCKACPFLDSNILVKGHSGKFKIHRSFHCQMSNVVYAITCKYCGKLYIGETERTLETRFSEHLASVRLNKDHLPVARHFNSFGHYIQEMRVQIFWRIIGDVVDRKYWEAQHISRLNTVSPFGLNLKS